MKGLIVSEWNGAYTTLEVANEIALIGLNRPEKRNAINDAVLDELTSLVPLVEKNAKAAVLFGHGPHFSAGLDLDEQSQRSPVETVMNSRRWHDALSRIEYGAVPWVAALHGAVIGGGLELASAVHVRVADETSFFALPEGQRGIFVGGGASVRTSRLIGSARVMDMMLTGRVVDAARAESWAMVQYVVRNSQAKSKAIEIAKASVENASLSNFAIIQALPRIGEMSKDDGLFVESVVVGLTGTSQEAETRLKNFLSKRASPIERPEKKNETIRGL
ncbi:MAG: crotonase/enoyl-CoA hydratase family protein [Mesorhizobium sp.]|uniref:crotonase/enoyl-CoA hydratase family protein n=1 Tax=Mesorhizobium sp. TaxID=1871066 RepID=UPI000FE9BEE0|nr:crotonase/enoyl-CoA hydratase family protein [Mesorhizobium sp.]RWI57103.1 MAG: crotonase/enoyl-CoA hydratase family protein [Mesorhizobium sp.]